MFLLHRTIQHVRICHSTFTFHTEYNKGTLPIKPSQYLALFVTTLVGVVAISWSSELQAQSTSAVCYARCTSNPNITQSLKKAMQIRCSEICSATRFQSPVLRIQQPTWSPDPIPPPPSPLSTPAPQPQRQNSGSGDKGSFQACYQYCLNTIKAPAHQAPLICRRKCSGVGGTKYIDCNRYEQQHGKKYKCYTGRAWFAAGSPQIVYEVAPGCDTGNPQIFGYCAPTKESDDGGDSGGDSGRLNASDSTDPLDAPQQLQSKERTYTKCNRFCLEKAAERSTNIELAKYYCKKGCGKNPNFYPPGTKAPPQPDNDDTQEPPDSSRSVKGPRNQELPPDPQASKAPRGKLNAGDRCTSDSQCPVPPCGTTGYCRVDNRCAPAAGFINRPCPGQICVLNNPGGPTGCVDRSDICGNGVFEPQHGEVCEKFPNSLFAMSGCPRDRQYYCLAECSLCSPFEVVPVCAAGQQCTTASLCGAAGGVLTGTQSCLISTLPGLEEHYCCRTTAEGGPTDGSCRIDADCPDGPDECTPNGRCNRTTRTCIQNPPSSCGLTKICGVIDSTLSDRFACYYASQFCGNGVIDELANEACDTKDNEGCSDAEICSSNCRQCNPRFPPCPSGHSCQMAFACNSASGQTGNECDAGSPMFCCNPNSTGPRCLESFLKEVVSVGQTKYIISIPSGNSADMNPFAKLTIGEPPGDEFIILCIRPSRSTDQSCIPGPISDDDRVMVWLLHPPLSQNYPVGSKVKPTCGPIYQCNGVNRTCLLPGTCSSWGQTIVTGMRCFGFNQVCCEQTPSGTSGGSGPKLKCGGSSRCVTPFACNSPNTIDDSKSCKSRSLICCKPGSSRIVNPPPSPIGVGKKTPTGQQTLPQSCTSQEGLNSSFFCRGCIFAACAIPRVDAARARKACWVTC